MEEKSNEKRCLVDVNPELLMGNAPIITQKRVTLTNPVEYNKEAVPSECDLADAIITA